MIHLIGIKRELNTTCRSLLSISPQIIDDIILNIKSTLCPEVVIINTCNRTEFYLNSNYTKEVIITKVFSILNWPKNFEDYIFYSSDKKAIQHLFEVSCGFHSKILGEDQILGQIKDSYLKSCELNAIKGDFHKLFALALCCGKEFKNKTKLYTVPVSYSSIAAKQALVNGSKNIAIVGLGKMGVLTLNYLVNKDIKKIYILGRNTEKIKTTLETLKYSYLINKKIFVHKMDDKKEIFNKVESIICCTSSQTPIICKSDLSNHPLSIFDLSLPANVNKDCLELNCLKLYDLDNLQHVDLDNKLLRKEVMEENRCIILKYMSEYSNYLRVKSITPVIKRLKKSSQCNSANHFKTYKNKQYTKNAEDLAETLISSTSNTYVNKAIEVLKEEAVNDHGDFEKTYEIIKRIFLTGGCQNE